MPVLNKDIMLSTSLVVEASENLGTLERLRLGVSITVSTFVEISSSRSVFVNLCETAAR